MSKVHSPDEGRGGVGAKRRNIDLWPTYYHHQWVQHTAETLRMPPCVIPCITATCGRSGHVSSLYFIRHCFPFFHTPFWMRLSRIVISSDHQTRPAVAIVLMEGPFWPRDLFICYLLTYCFILNSWSADFGFCVVLYFLWWFYCYSYFCFPLHLLLHFNVPYSVDRGMFSFTTFWSALCLCLCVCVHGVTCACVKVCFCVKTSWLQSMWHCGCVHFPYFQVSQGLIPEISLDPISIQTTVCVCPCLAVCLYVCEINAFVCFIFFA